MSLNAVISLFCSLVILLIFACSAAPKWRDPTAYQDSVEGFALLPTTWITPITWLTIWTESLIVVLLLGGLFWQYLRLFGLCLALLLLLLFTGTLISVVVRGLHVHCGCFGAHGHFVSATSLVHNVGLMIGCMVGILCVFITPTSGLAPVQDLLVTTLAAIAFVLLWTNLDEMTTVLRPQAVEHSR